jgi:hypothetical protein
MARPYYFLIICKSNIANFDRIYQLYYYEDLLIPYAYLTKIYFMVILKILVFIRYIYNFIDVYMIEFYKV